MRNLNSSRYSDNENQNQNQNQTEDKNMVIEDMMNLQEDKSYVSNLPTPYKFSGIDTNTNNIFNRNPFEATEERERERERERTPLDLFRDELFKGL